MAESRIGLTRRELVQHAVDLGKTKKQANKTNTRRLEVFVARRMDVTPELVKRPLRKAKDFTFGLNRAELKEVVKNIGMTDRRAQKASTKEMEAFIARFAADGKPTRPLPLTDKDKAGVRLYYDKFADINIFKSVKHLLYKIDAETTTRAGRENNFLRLSIAEAARVLYDGPITTEMLDELQREFEENDIGVSDVIALRLETREIIKAHIRTEEQAQADAERR